MCGGWDGWGEGKLLELWFRGFPCAVDNSSGSLQCLVCTPSTANCGGFEDLNTGQQPIPPRSSTTIALYLLLMNTTEYWFSIQTTILSWICWLSIPVGCQCGKKQAQWRLCFSASKAAMNTLLVVPPSLLGHGLFRVVAGSCPASDWGEDPTRLSGIKREGMGKQICIVTAAAAHPSALTSLLTAADPWTSVPLAPLSSRACSYAVLPPPFLYVCLQQAPKKTSGF